MPTRRGPTFYLIVSILTLLIASSRADDSLFCNLTINNAPVHFIFDSGANCSIIFRPTAERLGIKIIPVPPAALPLGEVHLDSTEPLILASGNASAKISMAVADVPPNFAQGIDGAITLDLLNAGEGKVILIDMEKHEVSPITFPTDIERWSKWKMVSDSPVPMFKCSDGETIGVATGASGGVYLSQKKWEKWSAQRHGQPASIDGYYGIDGQVHVSEEMLARQMTFGNFTLHDVPVRVEALPSIARTFKGFDAIIGSYVLYQMKVIIDRQHNTIYTLPNSGNPPAYNWNRLGAVFVPDDLVKSNDLTAHVVVGSPAYKAGIRDNDVLEKVDDLDVTKWKTDPTVLPLNRFWTKPAGTVLHLFLRRNDQPYDVQVTLKDLPPVD